MTRGGAAITAVASVLPPPRSQHELWSGFFAAHFRGVRWAELVYRSAGVDQRHPAVDPTIDDVSRWTTAERLQRYLAEAMPLAKGAATEALAIAGLDASDVGLLAVVSCTGYSTPGVDVGLARDLGLRPNTERLLIGHMGCHAALPAIGLVADYVGSRGRPALLLCVELPSLHIQPPSEDVQGPRSHQQPSWNPGPVPPNTPRRAKGLLLVAVAAVPVLAARAVTGCCGLGCAVMNAAVIDGAAGLPPMTAHTIIS